jgi:hypothetical protein
MTVSLSVKAGVSPLLRLAMQTALHVEPGGKAGDKRGAGEGYLFRQSRGIDAIGACAMWKSV